MQNPNTRSFRFVLIVGVGLGVAAGISGCDVLLAALLGGGGGNGCTGNGPGCGGGCPAPDAGDVCCQVCVDTCEYCPAGRCTPCGNPNCCPSSSGRDVVADNPANEYAAAPVAAAQWKDARGTAWVELRSGLNVPADVTWHSDRDGELVSNGDGNVFWTTLSPGTHQVSLRARLLPGDVSGKTISVTPITVDVR
ncbi:MAG: hypothetical protein L6Q92_01005 [Phycisphaerae bacterium]|nr:hypothetical protein [Phycisphaerae bacterium]